MRKLTDLKSIQAEYARENEARERREKGTQKSTWLKLKDGESVMVQFLQELDESSPNFSEKNGTGFIAVEHTAPHNFKIKAVCTADEDGCVGCEENQKGWASKEETGYKGEWKPRRRLYVNVLVRRENGEDEVAILSQSDGPRSITPALLEFAVDENHITKQWFKLSRKGAEVSDTSYSLFQKKADPDFDPEAYDVFDLDYAVRHVPYDKQRDFYGVVDLDAPAESPEPAVASAGAGKSLDQVEW